MSARAIRRAPPLWILLDILMVWVLVLLSTPEEESGVTYRFLGLPPGSVLFEVETPLRTDRRSWRHFDFGIGAWVESERVTPHDRENFLCEQCIEFLPDGVVRPAGLMVGLPSYMRARIHEAFFRSCTVGDCTPTLYIDGSGRVSTDPAALDTGRGAA